MSATEEDLLEDGFVDFLAAGQAAVGEFRCSECGYGVIVQRELPPCPMCQGEAWERGGWRPFTRASRTDD